MMERGDLAESGSSDPDRDTEDPISLADRASDVLRVAERSSDHGRLAEATSMLRTALAALQPDHPKRPAILGNLMAALDLDALREALDCARRAVDSVPPGDPDQAGNLSDLSFVARVYSERFDDPETLREAIASAGQSVAATGDDDPQRAFRLSNLAAAHLSDFDRTGDPRALEEALNAGRRATACLPARHPERAGCMSNLGIMLMSAYEQSDDEGLLDEAIAVGRDAVAEAGHDSAGRDSEAAMFLSNLGLMLQYRYERTGVLETLDEATDVAKLALAAAGPEDPDLGSYFSNLGNALQTRYERTGELDVLDEAVDLYREAVDVTASDHPELPGHLSNLGLGLQDRYERTGDRSDLADSVQACAEAVAVTPEDHPDRPVFLSALSLAVLERFNRDHDAMDLELGIAAAREAVERTPLGHVDLPGFFSNLGQALLTGYEAVQIEEAVEMARRSVENVPGDHPARSGHLTNLGKVLVARHELDGSDDALREAADVFREAALIPTASVTTRVNAAAGWGRAAADLRDWTQAVDGLATAVGLLPRIAPWNLTRPDQEYHLSLFTELAADAAACALHFGDPHRAIALLEQGRGVLIAQALDTRSDLTELHERGPALAEQFEHLRRELDGISSSITSTRAPRPRRLAASAFQYRSETERRQILARQWEDLIQEIRQLSGMAGFLRPPPVSDLLEVSARGPVAFINVSEYRSDALVLAEGDVHIVPLDLTPKTVREYAAAFSDAILSVHELSADGSELIDSERELTRVLKWLWDEAAGPVLKSLGMNGTPADGETWPRLWWCPVGLLSLLPLHAAGYHDELADVAEAPRTVIDRAVSSSTATIRALRDLRRERVGGPVRVLAVAVPRIDAQSDLPGARREVAVVVDCLPRGRVDVLEGEQATHRRILREVKSHNWIHFACHGKSDVAHPWNSQLLVHDHQTQPLTVVDISRLRLDDGELAFLSACETARITDALPDETVHITTAFQLAGFRQVIGTLWPVRDSLATRFARDVYSALMVGGDLDTRDAAPAVHAAVRRQRERFRGQPSAWAAYVHAGA